MNPIKIGRLSELSPTDRIVLFLGGLLLVGGKGLAEYTYIFLAGYYLFSKEDVAGKSEQYKWIFTYQSNSVRLQCIPVYLVGYAAHTAKHGYETSIGVVYDKSTERNRKKLHVAGTYCSNTILLYVLSVLLAYGATLVCCGICSRVSFFVPLQGR